MQNCKWSVFYISQIKPLDKNLINKIFSRYKNVVVLEENVKRGGLGSSLLEYANEYEFNIDILRINLGDEFIEHGTRNYLYELRNISENDILNSMKNKWPDLFNK